MSAYLVEPEHIRQIVSWAKQPSRNNISKFNLFTRERLPDSQEDMARCLALANIFSVKALYGDKDYNDDVCLNFLNDVTDYLGHHVDYKLSAADVYNMCCCLSYQSCEVDDWIETDAYWLISNIKATAAREMASNAKQKWDYKPNPNPVVNNDSIHKDSIWS